MASESFHPLQSIRKYVAASVLALTLISCAPHSALASNDDEDEHYDARVQGYDPSVELKAWGAGGSWMLLVLMGVVCVAVIFKDARRSHLD